jgi:hypothetical protein
MRQLPTLRFDRDWNVAADGLIIAGGRARVVYDAERLPSPRPLLGNGLPAWSITCCYRFAPESEIHTAAISGIAANGHDGVLELDVPHAATALELWFYASDRWGHREWDSDYGQNFHFPVTSIYAMQDAVILRVTDDATLV